MEYQDILANRAFRHTVLHETYMASVRSFAALRFPGKKLIDLTDDETVEAINAVDLVKREHAIRREAMEKEML